MKDVKGNSCAKCGDASNSSSQSYNWPGTSNCTAVIILMRGRQTHVGICLTSFIAAVLTVAKSQKQEDEWMSQERLQVKGICL